MKDKLDVLRPEDEQLHYRDERGWPICGADNMASDPWDKIESAIKLCDGVLLLKGNLKGRIRVKRSALNNKEAGRGKIKVDRGIRKSMTTKELGEMI